MAIEKPRMCGYRTQYSMYIVGDLFVEECDRLPKIIESCSSCGERPHFSRNLARINPTELFGEHGKRCIDDEFCMMCFPPKGGHHGLMWVGKSYYPSTDTFVNEVKQMGLSKKIPYVPSWVKKGESVLYLARKNMLDSSHKGFNPKHGNMKADAYFMAVRIKKIEYVLPEKEKSNKELLKELLDNDIDPVWVPDNDIDHLPSKSKKRPMFDSLDEIKEVEIGKDISNDLF